MFEHPLTWSGLCIAAGGWAFLLFEVGAPVGFVGTVVANAHAISIASNAIVTGLILFIAGVIVGASQRISSGRHIEINKQDNRTSTDVDAPQQTKKAVVRPGISRELGERIAEAQSRSE